MRAKLKGLWWYVMVIEDIMYELFLVINKLIKITTNKVLEHQLAWWAESWALCSAQLDYFLKQRWK